MTAPSPRRRVFYVAPVRIQDGGPDIPAARNKVLGVCAAIKAAGARPVIISTYSPSSFRGRFQLMGAARVQQVPAIQAFSRGRGGIKRIISFFSLWAAGAVAISSRDRVILYNYFPEYILLALWLRLRRVMCVLDIEDAPRSDEAGARGLMTRLCFPILVALCADRQLIVSDALGHRLGLKRFLAIHGVSSYFTRIDKPSEDRFSRGTVRVNFGGAMMPETGTELFCSALRHLAAAAPDTPLHFFITGHVSDGMFDTLVQDIAGSKGLRIEVLSGLGGDAYRALLGSMDVGLCLKLPSTQMGQTTFPSKVVEIAATGMLLVSTRVSDVPTIFADDEAVLLADEDPKGLAEALIAIAGDRSGAALRAKRGQALVERRFSNKTVGKAVGEFLDIHVP